MNRIFKRQNTCIICDCFLTHLQGISYFNRLDAQPLNRPIGIRQCCSCRFAWLDPQPIGSLIWMYPKQYLSDQNTSGILNSIFVSLMRWYRQDQYAFDFSLWTRATNKNFSTGITYLDIGAGSGERVEYVQNKGISAFGIDAYQYASEHLRQNIVNQSVESYFPGTKYLLIGVFHVLEHVPNPHQFLEHISTHLLADDGEMILQVPNYNSFERKLFGMRWFGNDIPRHLWHFSDKNIRILLEECGFSVLSIEKKNAMLHPVTFVSSLFRELDVQRMWVLSQSQSTIKERVKLILWIICTIVSLPFSVCWNLLQSGTMLSVVVKNKN